MNTTSSGLQLILPALIVTLVLCFSSTVSAENITEVTRDGVLHILNPDVPQSPVSKLSPGESWRLGGEEDEDIIFGVIGDIAVDKDGNVYLMDTQLNEIPVFSADGEYLRTIGREGEGPGEFRRPVGLYVSGAGDIAVVQAMPGKIILLTPGGEPAGIHPINATDDGVQFFSRADRSVDQITVASRTFIRREGGADITQSLIRIDANGDQTAKYLETSQTRQFTSSEMHEKSISGTLVWNVASDGRVYASDNFDSYTIKVFSPDGAIDRVIERKFEHRKRSDDEKKRRVPIMGMGRRRGGHNRPQMEIVASDTDRDVQEMYSRDNGAIWILNSRGAFDVDGGTLATFDVFDKDGRFVSQIQITGDGNFDRDEFHLVGDRLFVVTGVRSARRALRGESTELDTETEEAEILSVICYDLAPVLQGSL